MKKNLIVIFIIAFFSIGFLPSCSTLNAIKGKLFDTIYVDVPVYVHDTTVVLKTDTVIKQVQTYIHDTIFNNKTDTLIQKITVHDTINKIKTDTLIQEKPVYIHDTINILKTDTIVIPPIYKKDTTYLHDTIKVISKPIIDTIIQKIPIHDTIIKTVKDSILIDKYQAPDSSIIFYKSYLLQQIGDSLRLLNE